MLAGIAAEESQAGGAEPTAVGDRKAKDATVVDREECLSG
jgi:hypothetical protein